MGAGRRNLRPSATVPCREGVHTLRWWPVRPTGRGDLAVVAPGVNVARSRPLHRQLAHPLRQALEELPYRFVAVQGPKRRKCLGPACSAARLRVLRRYRHPADRVDTLCQRTDSQDARTCARVRPRDQLGADRNRDFLLAARAEVQTRRAAHPGELFLAQPPGAKRAENRAGAPRARYETYVAGAGCEGVRYARLARLSRAGTMLTVATNVGLGLVLVLLKALLAH